MLNLSDVRRLTPAIMCRRAKQLPGKSSYPAKAKPAGLLTAVFLSLLLGGCGSVQVRQDYAPGFDFNSLGSYQWHSKTSVTKVASPQFPQSLQSQRIEAALRSALAQHQMQEVKQNPDIWVHYAYRIEQRTEFRSYPSFGFWRHDPFDHDIVAHDYEVGILSVEMIEPASQRVIWQTEAIERVDAYQTPPEREAAINASVQSIFAKYPPDQGK